MMLNLYFCLVFNLNFLLGSGYLFYFLCFAITKTLKYGIIIAPVTAEIYSLNNEFTL